MVLSVSQSVISLECWLVGWMNAMKDVMKCKEFVRCSLCDLDDDDILRSPQKPDVHSHDDDDDLPPAECRKNVKKKAI